MQVPTPEAEGTRRNDRMVDDLVRHGAIRDGRIESAFRTVRRHWFLPDTPVDDVYRDRAVVTRKGPDGVPVSSSSQPALMARMLSQLHIEPGQRVLEIGTGSGYNAALLGHLVGAHGRVVTVDLDSDIAAAAEQHLRRAGASNVVVVAGDGWALTGMAPPFDRIEVTVGAWDLSHAWVEQLTHDGVLVVPLWLRAGLQASTAFHLADGRLRSLSIEPCAFMRMRGAGAGRATHQPVGSWTASLDEGSHDTARLLASLLRTRPSSQPAPPLEVGWFTPIALREADAVHLFSLRPEGPVVRAGILDVAAPGLAVVESRPCDHAAAVDVIHTFGSEEPRRRLLDLVQRGPRGDVTELAITALPPGDHGDGGTALTTLRRPNFTFVVQSGRRSVVA